MLFDAELPGTQQSSLAAKLLKEHEKSIKLQPRAGTKIPQSSVATGWALISSREFYCRTRMHKNEHTSKIN
jgi:hypothetical protein